MPIQIINIQGFDLKNVPPIECFMAQYVLNEKQQICVLSIDFDQYPVTFENVNNVFYHKAGKLNAQQPALCQQIINSLNFDKWDFDKFPNPEIVIITNNNSVNSINNG